jgi:hypothetical protein
LRVAPADGLPPHGATPRQSLLRLARLPV